MMNKLNLILGVIAATMMLTFSACTTDPVEPTAPSIVFNDGVGAVTSSDSIAVDSFFLIKVSANTGSGSFSTIEVQENGTAITDLSRLDFNGFPAGSNPSPLGAADTAGFDWDLRIQAPSAVGENDYTVIVSDDNGLSAQLSVTVSTFIPFTDVDTNTVVLRLRNQGGPAGQGGLDLDTGNETGTTNSAADETRDLQDSGIDLNLPNADNWIQTFSAGPGGVTLRKIDNAVDFFAVQYKEEVEELFNNGTDITGTTDVVQMGDKFAVRTNAGTIMLLYTAEVAVTPTDNGDFYRFNAKF
ncbi:MAG: hypothetical protein AAFY71_22905 [Bacteroidota bacterium]